MSAVPAPSSDSGVAFQIVPGATAAYTAGNQMLTRISPTFPRTAVGVNNPRQPIINAVAIGFNLAEGVSDRL